VKNITRVPISVIYKGAAPFLISLIFVWGLLFFFPELALWLPSVFYK
jgi:TRAP-type C4-dicarboxylate transport system permease large subunit